MVPFLETVKLTKRIKEGEGERILFKDVSLSFKARGLYTIIGQSGSGKSTFLHLLSSLERPSGGEIRFRDKNVCRFKEKDRSAFRKKEIGFVFQSHHLEGNYTVKENLLLPLLLLGIREKEGEARVKKSLKDCSLLHLIDKKASTCSGGEKARIAFLRAVIKEPSILLADEPTGALDKKNATALMEWLKAYSKRHLVVLVTHDLSLAARYADCVLEIKNGDIVCEKQKKAIKTPADCDFRNEKLKKERLFLFYRKSLKSERRKHLFSFVTSFLLFLNFSLFFGFLEGGSSFMREGEDRSLLYLSSSLSKSEKVSLEGSRLTLSRSYRPSKEESLSLLEGLKSAHVENDYSFFFPPSLSYRENGYLKESASFCPIWDITLHNRSRSFLLQGELPKGDSLSFVLINEAMASSLSNPLEDYLDVHYEASFLYDGSKETVLFENRFQVIGIVKDFAFLSLPRVFYSYPAFEERMKETFLSSGESVFEAVSSSKAEDEWNSYSYQVYFDEMDAKRVKQKAKGEIAPFELSNVLWSSQEAFSSLWGLLEGVLIPFLCVIALLSFFSLFSLTRSSYIENRRSLALFDALGMSEKGRLRVFENPLAFILVLSLLLSIAFGGPLSSLLSSLLEHRFGLSSLVALSYTECFGVPFFVPLALLSLIALLLLCGCRLPLFFLSRKSLAKELKDE